MQRTPARSLRGPGVAIIAAGAVLLLASFAEAYIANRATNVADLVRPELTDEGLAQHRADFEAASAVVNGLGDEVLPILASALNIAPQVLIDEIEANFPATGRLLEERQEIMTLAESSLVNLENQQANFEKADSLPAEGLPWWSSSVGGILLAVATLAAGFMLLRAPSRNRAITAVAVTGGVGLLLIVVPLALNVPGKASAAQEVLDSLNPSQSVVDRTNVAVDTTDAAADEVQAGLMPGIAARLGISADLLLQAIDAEFPQVAEGIIDLPSIIDRYQARAEIRENGAGDLRFLKGLPVAELGWAGPLMGMMVLGLAAWGLLVVRKNFDETKPAKVEEEPAPTA